MIRFNRSTIPPAKEVLKSFAEVLDSGVVTNNGSRVRALEAELAMRSGSRYALTTVNGTLGLQLAVHALGRKGEIITTPFTFVATASSIIWEACTPVFADIDPETLCLDPHSVEQHISERTVAIMPVHIFGNVSDIDGLEKVARKHGLPTVYDAAQAFGSTYRGRPCTSYGTLSVISAHAYKVFSTVEGGAIFCDDEDLHEKLFMIRYFGKDRSNTEVMTGINGKMSEFNAAYGLLSLKTVDDEIAERKRLHTLYMERIDSMDGLAFQSDTEGCSPNRAYMPVILPDADITGRLVERAYEQKVEFRRYFHPALSQMPFLGGDPAHTPVAVDIASRIICLPLYSGLNESDLDHIAGILRQHLN